MRQYAVGTVTGSICAKAVVSEPSGEIVRHLWREDFE